MARENRPSPNVFLPLQLSLFAFQGSKEILTYSVVSSSYIFSLLVNRSCAFSVPQSHILVQLAVVVYNSLHVDRGRWCGYTKEHWTRKLPNWLPTVYIALSDGKRSPGLIGGQELLGKAGLPLKSLLHALPMLMMVVAFRMMWLTDDPNSAAVHFALSQLP